MFLMMVKNASVLNHNISKGSERPHRFDGGTALSSDIFSQIIVCATLRFPFCAFVLIGKLSEIISVQGDVQETARQKYHTQFEGFTPKYSKEQINSFSLP